MIQLDGEFREKTGSGTNDWRLYFPKTTWAQVINKPSWIGDSKPSYAWSEITGKPLLSVAALGSTSVPTYTVFASQTISAQGNTNSSYLVVGGGNFGGTYNGMWLVECSGRGSVATMRVTELAHNASGTVGFGHYVSSGKAYFGMTRSSYGAGIDIYHLNGALGELKLFQNNTTMPTGWTAVTPSILAKTSDLPDTSKFVTTDTAQTISGDKKFSKGTGANAHTEISILPYNGSSPTRAYGIDINTNATTATYGAAGISMSETQGAKYSYSFPKDSGTLALEKNIPDVSKFLPLAGGEMTGALKFAQSACSDADGPSYLLAMTSFSAGGEVKYTHVRNLTSKGNLQWTSATHTNATGYLFDGNYIPTINTLAYWNGAYSGTSSNLTYCAGGEILSKSGGTLTASAQLQRAGISKTWVKGREAAIIRTTSAGSASSPIYAPIFSQKSANGSWEFGAYTGDTAHLSYIKDTDYTANNNVQTADYQFAPNKKGIVAIMDDITWENMGGKPTNLVTTDGNQQTISSIKTLTGDWTGIKNAYGTEATSMFAAHEFEAYQDHHGTPNASNHLAYFEPDKISRWLNTSTGYEYAFPNQSGTLALKEEQGIVIRAKYICARKNNDGEVLQVKIEFVSGKELVQPTDRIVLAQLRSRSHKNRASKYRYRNDCSITGDAFPADGIFNFILPRGLTRNNSNTDRSSIIANKRIYISRNQSKKDNDNWVRISNAISFRPLHNGELNHTAFAIDGD